MYNYTETELIVELIFTCIMRYMWGCICYHIAISKNRNSKIAFALGFLFTLFSMVGYIIVGNKSKS